MSGGMTIDWLAEVFFSILWELKCENRPQGFAADIEKDITWAVLEALTAKGGRS